MPTPISVQNCANVTACTNLSWDLLFCICNGGGCQPGHGRTYTNNDGMTGLVGVYSTDWTSSGTSPSTGGGSATWSSLSNMLTDNGSYATIVGDSNSGSNPPFLGGQYAVLTGPGFAVPAGSAIIGIAMGIKGFAYTGAHDTGYIIYNTALVLSGTLYYLADPRGDWLQTGYVAHSPYPTSGNDTRGFPLNIDFAQPQMFGGSSFGFWNAAGSPSSPTGPVTLNASIGAVTTTSPGVGDDWGTMPGCAPTNSPNHFGIQQKNLSTPTLKQSWSPAEVNDSSFGFAFSAGCRGNASTSQLSIDSVGIAVYYVPGAGGGGTRYQPTVCVNC